jgi:alpha-glucosidase
MAIMYEAIIMQMTWPGAPTLYYGDEAGVCGWTDPDNRRTYPWGHENLELMEFYRYMMHVHRHNHALKTGALKILGYGNGMVMYGRFESGSVVVTAVNNSDVDMDIDIPVWQLGIKDEDIMERLLTMKGIQYNIGKVDAPVENGYIHTTIHGKGGLVYRRKLK